MSTFEILAQKRLGIKRCIENMPLHQAEAVNNYLVRKFGTCVIDCMTKKELTKVNTFVTKLIHLENELNNPKFQECFKNDCSEFQMPRHLQYQTGIMNGIMCLSDQKRLQVSNYLFITVGHPILHEINYSSIVRLHSFVVKVIESERNLGLLRLSNESDVHN